MKYWFNENKDIKLYQGGCLEIMDKLIELGVRVDCVVVDPPYGMNFVSNRRKKQYKKIHNDDHLDWIDSMSFKLFSILKNNSHAYVFCSFHNVDIFKSSLEKYFKIKNILIWQKNNHGSGDLKGDYAPKYEMIIYLNKGRKDLNGKRVSNILEFKKTGNKFHPTEKPVDLLEFLINKSTEANDVVLDCFMGSGGTGVACKNLNRKFIGIELDEKYFDIAVDRIKGE